MMTEPKQDVTIAAINSKPNALNFLASLSSSSSSSASASDSAAAATNVSRLSLGGKTIVAMETSTASRNKTSSTSIKRRLEELNKTTVFADATTTTVHGATASSSNKKAKKTSKQPTLKKTKPPKTKKTKKIKSPPTCHVPSVGASASTAPASHVLGGGGRSTDSIFDTTTVGTATAGLASNASTTGNTVLDAYLRERLLAVQGGTATASSVAVAGGSPTIAGSLGLSPSPSPTLASIMAARRSNQMLPNHLGLMLHMNDYDRALLGLSSGQGGGLPGAVGSASSFLYGRLGVGGLDSNLLAALGGQTNVYGSLAGGSLGSIRGLTGTPAGSHLMDAASFQSLRSSSFLGGLSAAERLEALGLRGPVLNQLSSPIGTDVDKLSALAMTAAAATSGTVITKHASAPEEKATSTLERSVTKGGLGPARRKSNQSRTTNDDKIIAVTDLTESSDRDQFSQRFRGYQCEQWTEKFNDLLKFKEENGHCQVPHAYKENVGLARWVKRQRYQYKLLSENKQSTMTPERVKLLEDIGFIWDSHASTWEDRLDELKEYAATHGNCNVPSSYSGNPKLATWIKCQRRQYKLLTEGRTSNMTLERMKELERIGFKWRVQP